MAQVRSSKAAGHKRESAVEIPPIQVALDLLDLPRAVQIAKEAVQGILAETNGDISKAWLEAGTPLIKSEGMNAVRTLRDEFPGHTICADMKVMDAGSTEVEMAAKAGANIVFILGDAPDSCITEAVLAAKKYGVRLAADLIAVKEPAKRAAELEKLGVDIINIHIGLDQQVLGLKPIELVKQVSKVLTQAMISAAGGLNSETAVQAWEAGADIIIVGGALYKARSPEESARKIVQSLKQGKPIATKEFVKYDAEHLVEAFMKVSTANISDAMHRTGELRGLKPVWVGEEPGMLKFAGPAVTVRTYDGDWSAPVKAIDYCKKGDVIVIDACRGEIAVWGELATHSCITRGVAGVVIDGAVRDIDDIRKLKFPVFARNFTPTAGEPKGYGEINAPIEVCNRKVEPGDWIIGDESGVVVVPKAIAMEIANRAIDVNERENRIREEIERGSTLGKTQYLAKWDVKK